MQHTNISFTTALFTSVVTLFSSNSFASNGEFTVNQANIYSPSVLSSLESSYPNDNVSQIQATQINGLYNEQVQILSASPEALYPGLNQGTLFTQLLFVASSFTTPSAIDYSGLSGTQGSPANYGIYGTFTGMGSFTQSWDSTNPAYIDTVFSLTSGQFDLFLDPNLNTNMNLILGGSITPAAGGALLASSSAIKSGSGQEVINSSTGTCVTTLNTQCGQFNFIGDVALTQLGSQVFSSPDPFYVNFDTQGGLTNIFVTSYTSSFVAGAPANVSFFGETPEPAVLALLGIGALGLLPRKGRPS